MKLLDLNILVQIHRKNADLPEEMKGGWNG